jgi:hypothetical protein
MTFHYSGAQLMIMHHPRVPLLSIGSVACSRTVIDTLEVGVKGVSGKSAPTTGLSGGS